MAMVNATLPSRYAELIAVLVKPRLRLRLGLFEVKVEIIGKIRTDTKKRAETFEVKVERKGKNRYKAR
jgi:hypothetical protein